MTQRTRLFVAIAALLLVIGGVLAVDLVQRKCSAAANAGAPVELQPGAIPIYVNGRLVAGFGPEDLEQLEPATFVDAEEGKPQDGWLLREVLLLYVPESSLHADTAIVVSSSSRGESAQLTWAQVDEPANMVMFDLSNRGTLKLVSLLEELDTRDEWVKDVDRIEIGDTE
jgi:hypothetical protein